MPLFLLKYGKHIALVIAILALLTGVYFFGHKNATTAKNLEITELKNAHLVEVIKVKDENAAKLKELTDKYYQASTLFEMDLSNLKTKEKVIKDVVLKEIEKPIYSSCLVPDDGVRKHEDTRNTLNSTRVEGTK